MQAKKQQLELDMEQQTGSNPERSSNLVQVKLALTWELSWCHRAWLAPKTLHWYQLRVFQMYGQEVFLMILLAFFFA